MPHVPSILPLALCSFGCAYPAAVLTTEGHAAFAAGVLLLGLVAGARVVRCSAPRQESPMPHEKADPETIPGWTQRRHFIDLMTYQGRRSIPPGDCVTWLVLLSEATGLWGHRQGIPDDVIAIHLHTRRCQDFTMEGLAESLRRLVGRTLADRYCRAILKLQALPDPEPDPDEKDHHL